MIVNLCSWKESPDVNLYSYKESPDVILHCYAEDCKNNSRVIFSFENVTLHKLSIGLSYVETTFAGISFLMKSIIPPPFLYRYRRNGVPKLRKTGHPEKNHLL